MTRGQISRYERERQQIRNLYTAIFAVLTVVFLILAFAVVSSLILKPNVTVASVQYEGQPKTDINRATYNKLRRWNVWQQATIGFMQSQSTGMSDPSTVIAQLQAVENENSLDSQTLSQLTDGEVLRQAAKGDFQLDPSKDELRAYAKEQFIPQPTPPTTPAPPTTPTSEITGTATLTPTSTSTFTPGPPTHTPTKTPTLPPVPGAEKTAEVEYKNYMELIDASVSQGQPDISEDDYLTLLVEPQYLQEKVTDELASDVMTNVEQIHAQHILTTSPEGAQQLIKRLDEGADFTKLANEQSKEQLDNLAANRTQNGGDLGWFPKEGSNLVPEFVEGAWPVQAGTYTTAPVQTSFGWHIIKVLERDSDMELTEEQRSSIETSRYTKWYDGVIKKSQISPAPTPTPVPATQPPIVNPPAATATPTVATGGGAGATGTVTGTSTLTNTGTLTGTSPVTGTSPITGTSPPGTPAP
jgi:parvulin-like peptidyl-prolyl isomerase